MSAQKWRCQISSSMHEVLFYACNIQWSPLKEIQAQTGIAVSIISDMTHHAAKKSKHTETSPVKGSNTAANEHSDWSELLDQTQIEKMIALVTSSYSWRCKNWMTVTKKCNIPGVWSIIELAFHETGYNHYSSQFKPSLTPEMKERHLAWCKEWKDWNMSLQNGWGKVIFSDKTSVRLGENWGWNAVTRIKDEEWEKDCCKKIYKKFSSFMFWEIVT